MNKRLLATSFFSFLLLILLFSNPNESKYLEEIQDYYASRHVYAEIPAETIKNIGKHERVTYLLFSTYTYHLGKRKVYYFGIANNVFFLGSKRQTNKKMDIKVA